MTVVAIWENADDSCMNVRMVANVHRMRHMPIIILYSLARSGISSENVYLVIVSLIFLKMRINSLKAPDGYGAIIIYFILRKIK